MSTCRTPRGRCDSGEASLIRWAMRAGDAPPVPNNTWNVVCRQYSSPTRIDRAALPF
jgi:hypothetical protein